MFMLVVLWNVFGTVIYDMCFNSDVFTNMTQFYMCDES